MNHAATLKTRISHAANGFSPAAVYLDSLLYYILANVVEGKAADTLLNCPDGYGLE